MADSCLWFALKSQSHTSKVFSKFMETLIGVSTRLSRNSKSTPLVTLSVQYDGTEKEIQVLHSVTGKNVVFFQ